ncbi:histone-like nucleoid-structuring protein Lsr2 [Streptomyces huasconensis]|uniref:Histone-like nucleoid-structuring protein Lsr2 n=1 Tax=Streptomyces huasconensis TaxID=1854574 RepID=A0ABV3M616_9ACTN
MRKALEAEALELTPLDNAVSARTSVVVARHARDKDGLTDLLGALGLPCGEDDLVRLLPHLPTTPDDTPAGDTMPANAFTATAVSMLTNGESPDRVRETLGLSENELAEAVQHAGQHTPATNTGAGASAAGLDGIEALLGWAENHPAASIRTRAARVRAALTELSERRCADQAQREAEKRVARAKAELEAAQAQLRQVKAGGHTTATSSSSPAPAASDARKRTSQELAAIRTWARAHGHQVAGRGNPPKTVLEAYDAAHRTTLAEAS